MSKQTKQKAKEIFAKFVPIDKISENEITEMHKLVDKYYDNAFFDTFYRDIKDKNGAFIIKKKKDKSIVGFSTATILNFKHNGKRINGLFSGDTILEKEYWGTPNLQIAFTQYIIIAKLKRILVPFYWILISKGYKTYLLLANNFPNYHPRYDKQRYSNLKDIVESFCLESFPEFYSKEDGLLRFHEGRSKDYPDGYPKLKDGVTEITDEMRAMYPKTAFFEKCNPSWKDGTELPCIGMVNLFGIMLYPFTFFTNKVIKKKFIKPPIVDLKT